MEIQSKYDFIIVGGGVYGLSIAYYLSKYEDFKIALLEQYAIGHNKGSSHQTTRIARSLYQKELYRDLNIECSNKNWPELEKSLNQKIFHQNEFVYFTEDEKSYHEYKEIAQKQPCQNVKICQDFHEYEEYFKGRKFPLIRSEYPPIIDKKAGIIYSSVYIKKLKQYLCNKCENVVLMEHTFVQSILQNKNQASVETSTQILRANKVIISAGQWVQSLVPELAHIFAAVKQHISYLELEDEPCYQVGRYPAFIHQYKDGRLYYCAPSDKIQKLGVKLGQHRNSKPFDSSPEQYTFNYNYENLRKKALEYFEEDLIRVKTVKQCWYTNTKSNDFVIDWIGQSEKILVCSCCSGHGFKFAPILGQMISQIVTAGTNEAENRNKEGRIRNDILKKWGYLFKIAYHQGVYLI